MKFIVRYRKYILGLLSIMMGALCLLLIMDRPIEAPVNESMNYYMQYAKEETTAANVVTAIYLNYRVFDTVFEALLLLVAVTATLFIYPVNKKKKIKIQSEAGEVLEPLKDLLVFILPFIMLFGVALILNGDRTPGGGFQGGAVLVVIFIAGFLIENSREMDLDIFTLIEKFAFISLTLIIATFLYYNFRDMPQGIKRSYLILINALIGVKVCAGLGIIFYRFSRLKVEEDEGTEIEET